MDIFGLLSMGLLTTVYSVKEIVTETNDNQCNIPPTTNHECNNRMVWMLAKQLETLDTAVHDIKEMQRQLIEEKTMRIKSDEEIASNRNQIKENDDKIASLRTNLNLLTEKIMNAENNQGPAFLATLATGIRKVGNGEILKFNNVHLNRGGGYNPATGEFTVTKPGVYAVTCTLRTYTTYLHFWICKNNAKLHQGAGHSGNTITIHAIMELTKGDRIYIQHQELDNEYIHPPCVFSAVFIS